MAVWILTMYISLNWGSTPSAPQQPAAPVRARRSTPQRPAPAPLHSRIIPQWVKIAVAHRDGGTCRQCGSDYELQYDHIIPFSRGGSSTDVNNIQLLCGRCNRRKSNRYVG